VKRIGVKKENLKTVNYRQVVGSVDWTFRKLVQCDQRTKWI